VKAILKEIRKLTRQGISSRELKKAKERYLCDLEKDKDSPARMCIRYGMWEMKGNSYSLEEEKRLIQQIEVSDMGNLIDYLLTARNLNLAVMGAFTKKEEKEVRQLIKRY